MKFLGIGTILFSMMAIGTTRHACAEQTTPYAFVTEYVRELYENERVRANAEQEFKASTSRSDQLSNIIHASTLTKLELASQVRMLKDIRLNSPFDTLAPNIIQFYEEKIELHQKMIDMARVFLAGPKPNVNYDDLAAKMPEVRASLDDIEHTLFKITQLVFMLIINQTPDSKNHLNHLVITKAERSKLIHDIELDFGERLDLKNQSYAVTSAQLIREMLREDNYKSADDPWE